jgi:protein required for attachment to host cells
MSSHALGRRSAVPQDVRIARDTWVLVADGRKAIILRNKGNEEHPDLRVQQVHEAPPNPATHHQGADRPPRVVSIGRRSTIEQTDWHEVAERRFAGEVAARLNAADRELPIKALVVVAPPKTLAELRAAFSAEIRQVIVAEINKDLTRHPIPEIERYFTRPM